MSKHIRFTGIAVAASVAIFLAGCGGGGSSSSGMRQQMPTAQQVRVGHQIVASEEIVRRGMSTPGTLGGVEGTFTCASQGCELSRSCVAGTNRCTVTGVVGVTFTPTSAPQTGGMTQTPTRTDFAGLSPTNAGYAATAASRAADARPRSGSVTQSSNVNNGITVDRVSVTAQHGASRNSYSIRNGSSWSISTSDGNPVTIDASDPWDGQRLYKRTNGGTLYVDVVSDIEAPSSQQVGGSDDGTRNVPLGTRVFTGSVSGSSGGVSGLSGRLNGESGTFSCSGGCTYSRGVATAGTWTFTPNRPPGAINISGVSGVAFTGTFNAARTPGTYNGRTGYFRCLSSSCGRSTSNGRLSSLQGQWIFVPAGGTTVSTPDTNYLAGGVWLFVPDNATSADNFVFGAFADGNDPFRQSNLVALQGAARYVGGAAGAYTDRSENWAGYWTGQVTLDADFGGRSDLGSIDGSVTGIEADDELVSGSMRLDRANIGSSNSGFFEGQLNGTVNGIGFTGRWGGQFFGNSEADGKPGSVGGTAAGRSADGSVSFVGGFGAFKRPQE